MERFMMSGDGIRADGWENVAAVFLTTLFAGVIWYTHDFYVNRIVLLAGIVPGVVLYFIIGFSGDRPVAGLPITMIFMLAMLLAASEESLVAGVVTTFGTATAILAYDVYL